MVEDLFRKLPQPTLKQHLCSLYLALVACIPELLDRASRSFKKQVNARMQVRLMEA